MMPMMPTILRRVALFSLLLACPALAAPVRVTMQAGKAKDTVVIKVENAGPVQRVTVPWGVAQQLAFAARQQGGLMVSTAMDGFTGGMLRLVAGQAADNMIILDRMRRGGPNGQSGVAALRFQRGLGADAFYIARTREGAMLDQHWFVGRSSVSRRGAVLLDPRSLHLNQRDTLDGMRALWYTRPTNKVTTDPRAPLQPFAPYGAAKGVTASRAELVVKVPLLGVN